MVEKDDQTGNSEGRQPQRRGIIPFENGFTPRERGNFGPYTSPTFSTAAGNMFAVLWKYDYPTWRRYTPSQERHRRVYALLPNGEVYPGTEEYFRHKGYANLQILIEPFDRDNILEETQRKGEFDCAIQLTDELVLRGSNRLIGHFRLAGSLGVVEADNPLVTSFEAFSPEGQKEERGLIMINPDDLRLRSMTVNFTSHLEFEDDTAQAQQ